jgi:hypothetical protein
MNKSPARQQKITQLRMHNRTTLHDACLAFCPTIRLKEATSTLPHMHIIEQGRGVGY